MSVHICAKNEDHWYPSDNEYVFCPGCGSKLLQKCSECQADILKPEHKFCVKCGAEFRPDLKKKEKGEEEQEET
jgi:DNA-directed RNA polymerase subunit RPC12/RpoP